MGTIFCVDCQYLINLEPFRFKEIINGVKYKWTLDYGKNDCGCDEFVPCCISRGLTSEEIDYNYLEKDIYEQRQVDNPANKNKYNNCSEFVQL